MKRFLILAVGLAGTPSTRAVVLSFVGMALVLVATPARANKSPTPSPTCGATFAVINKGHHTVTTIYAFARMSMQTGSTAGRTGGFADAYMPNLVGIATLKPGGSVHPLATDMRPDNPQWFTLTLHYDDGHATHQDVNICAGSLTLSY